MPNATVRANARGLPEPRFRIAHLIRDPALRAALKTAEDDLGPIPLLPDDKSSAAGADDSESIFNRVFCEAREERARRDLVEAQFITVFHVIRGKELDDFQAVRRIAWARLREVLARLAETPAMTHCRLKRKKRMIGKAWLRDSVFSDAVARDEAYLTTKAAAKKEAAR